MRRHFLTTILVSAVVLVTACVSDQPSPMAPPLYSNTGIPACNVSRVTALINGLYPPGPARGSAHQQFATIRSNMNKGATGNAHSGMFAFLKSTLVDFAAGRLLGPSVRLGLSTGGAVGELGTQLYACSGLADQAPPDLGGVFESGGGAGVIVPSSDPEPQVVSTPDGRAAASFPPGSVDQPVLVTITPDPLGASPFPRTFTEYEPFFDFATFPHVERFGALVTVGICVNDPDIPPGVFGRLQLAHPDPDTNRETLELLPRVAPPPAVICGSPGGDIGLTSPRTPNGWMPMLGSIARRALGLFAPKQLHALIVVVEEGGLGGTTDSFTGFRAVDPESGTVSIDDVELSSTTLTIGGPNVDYTATYTNGTGATLSGVVLQGYIDQGEGVSRAAGGVVALCGAGNGVVPAGSCSQEWSLIASNTGAGTGTLVPGSATARIELIRDGVVLATFTTPVTLVAPGALSLDAVELSSTTLTIGGPNVDYTATLTNGTGATVSGVVLQGYIDQGEGVSRAAGGVVALCGAENGIVPPGPCSQEWSLIASNTGAGTGTLVPGSATARIELIRDEVVLATFTMPITLVAPGVLSLDAVELSSTTLTIDGPSVSYVATMTNGTGATVSGVVLQGWVDQGETASRAGGGVVALCGADNGVVPPGLCSQEWSLIASNTGAGTGTLVPGSATARIELIRDGVVVATVMIPITLAP